jgi:hypothetical protein
VVEQALAKTRVVTPRVRTREVANCGMTELLRLLRIGINSLVRDFFAGGIPLVKS